MGLQVLEREKEVKFLEKNMVITVQKILLYK